MPKYPPDVQGIQPQQQDPSNIMVEEAGPGGLMTVHDIMGSQVNPVLSEEGQGPKSVTDARQQQKIAALQAMMQGGGGQQDLAAHGVQETPRIWRQT